MSNDYLIRQIEDMTRALAQALFQRKAADAEIWDIEGGFSQGNFLLYRLRQMVLQRRVNEAENLLFDMVDNDPDESYLAAALLFYKDLADMSDEELTACGFSREEIAEGLAEIKKRYPQYNTGEAHSE